MDNKKRALITARFTQDGMDILNPILDVKTAGYGTGTGILSEQDVISMVSGLEVLVVELELVTKAVFDAAPKLKVVGSCRGTPNNVDIDEATRRGIPVLFTPGRNAVSVAEMALTLMLSLARNFIPAVKCLQQGIWGSGDDSPFIKFRGTELFGKTLGLVGFGAIGRELATRAVALGMKVLVYDPFVDEKTITELGYKTSSLNDLLANSDFISLHAKVTDKSRGMIGAPQFAMMKKTAFIINTAGGLLVDEAAMIDALRTRQIAGAGLDVFKEEPVAANNPLLELENVIAIPHIGGATSDVTNHQAVMMAQDLKRCLQGEKPRHVYNPEIYTK